jgi:hypothetical protein
MWFLLIEIAGVGYLGEFFESLSKRIWDASIKALGKILLR